VWLSHGRRTLPSRMSRVNCLEGLSQCERWQGSWPEKCHVGAMGWLLTSRQAYVLPYPSLFEVQISFRTVLT
jgi:hypothetical protein